ncbi:MAG: RNA polymerase Rpb6 [Bacteroidetes bacterium]|nr:MAG: RNA polymerase Rpb6 [Bacteroidota bacterium]
MNYKKTNAASSTITRNQIDLDHETVNIYETLAIISRRSNQISTEIKEELNTKLEEFASYTDNLEEIFENREQIEISKFYERLPKPSLIAIQEYLEGKIYHRNPDQDKV